MKTVIYSKFSNERARKFSIRTDICQEGECRWVEKWLIPGKLCPMWREFFGGGGSWNKSFPTDGLHLISVKNRKGVKLAYVQAKNLEEYLDERWWGAG